MERFFQNAAAGGAGSGTPQAVLKTGMVLLFVAVMLWRTQRKEDRENSKPRLSCAVSWAVLP